MTPKPKPKPKPIIPRTTPISDLPELLRVGEAAVWLDVSEGVVYSMVKAGQLDHRRLGRLVRITRASLAEWVRSGGAPVDVGLTARVAGGHGVTK